jgi:hypothetical protein
MARVSETGTPTGDSPIPGGVRVDTPNLWGRRGAWAERRRVLVEGFRELRPDLGAFQEAVVNDGYDQVADILGLGFHVAHQKAREAQLGRAHVSGSGQVSGALLERHRHHSEDVGRKVRE